MLIGDVIAALVLAFITGALARFALPGPDPMPVWRKAASWSGLASFAIAVGLVVIYRRFVQKRPLWGKEAHRFPERGFGVEQYRERLKRAGIDPDQIGSQPFGVLQSRPPMQPQPAAAPTRSGDAPTDNPAHFLRLLEELHDTGVLEDDEYTAAKTRLLESLRPS